MDSDAAIAAAQSSIHLLRVFFSVCRDLVALRRNPIRSAPESQIVLFFSKSRQSRKHNSTLRWTQGLQTRRHEVQYIARKYFSPFAEILSRCGEIRSDRSLLGTRSAENHEKSMVFIEFLDDATRSSQTKKLLRSKCIEASAAKFIAPEHA